MSFENFVDIVLNMRGTNVATVKDVEAQVRVIKAMMQKSLKDMHDKVQDAISHGFNKNQESIKGLRKLWLGEDDSESHTYGGSDERGNAGHDDDQDDPDVLSEMPVSEIPVSEIPEDERSMMGPDDP